MKAASLHLSRASFGPAKEGAAVAARPALPRSLLKDGWWLSESAAPADFVRLDDFAAAHPTPEAVNNN